MELRYQDLPIAPAEPISPVGIDRCYAYLAERGVSKKDIDSLGIRILRAQDIGWHSDPRAAIVFPHFTINDDLLDWWSARLIDLAPPEPAKGFAAMTEPPKSRPKMVCPPKEPPAAYLVPSLKWGEMPRGAVVYIHESCIKAINGANCDTYSIGLNGVEGWSSKKHDIALLSQIKDLPWKAKGLKCAVVFDSNANSNDGVALAIHRFAAKMKEICEVDVKHLLLPKPPPEFAASDWGFDDYCAYYGVDRGKEFLAGWEAAPAVNLSELEMYKLRLNEEVVLVKSIKKVVEQGTNTLLTRSEFAEMNYAHYIAMVDGKSTNVPLAWLRWAGRRTVERLVYEPNGERLKDGDYLNLWKGMGVTPVAGDATPWLELLERVIPDQKLRAWVIQWFAYPLQNLGAKMNSFIHMFGPGGGGKGAILAPIIAIYGPGNAISLGRERVVSDFNEVYSAKQFLNIDEMHSGTDREGVAVAQKIKILTTSPTLTINGKGKAEYVVNNHINLVTTGNLIEGLKLDDGDRRCLVLRIAEHETIEKSQDYWKPYYTWANSTEGQAALYDYLLGVDMSGFDAAGWAPHTVHKEDLTEANMTPMEGWCKTLRDSPGEVLDPLLVGSPALSTATLVAQYIGEENSGKSTQWVKTKMGTTLREVGFKKTDPVKVPGEKQARLWILDPALKGKKDEEVRAAVVAWKTRVKF